MSLCVIVSVTTIKFCGWFSTKKSCIVNAVFSAAIQAKSDIVPVLSPELSFQPLRAQVTLHVHVVFRAAPKQSQTQNRGAWDPVDDIDRELDELCVTV